MKAYDVAKDHITLITSQFTQQISAELFKKFDINGFRHVQLYYEGSRFEFTTDPHWFKHFMHFGYFNYSRMDRHASCYQPGYILWGALEKKGSHEIMMQDAIQNFDGGQGLTIIRGGEKWIDKFEFSASMKNTKANENFLSNLDYFDHFVDYFLTMMSDWTEKAHQAREFLPYVIDTHEENSDNLLPTHILNVTKRLKNLATNAINLKLTKRELECLYWLSLGKTVGEIAMILNISSRTVEKFIIAIKEKFDCRTLFQVGQIMSQIKLDRLLQNIITR